MALLRVVSVSVPDSAGARRLERLAGPECLGRSLLVSPGQTAPPPWRGRPRLVVDMQERQAFAAAELRRAWCERRRVVIEVHGPLPNPLVSLERPWWELSPGITLGEEVWHHLLTANAVDARDPLKPRFAPLESALALGAAVPDPEHPGDVLIRSSYMTAQSSGGGERSCATPEHTRHQAQSPGGGERSVPTWCDGGPLAFFEPDDLAGAQLVCHANLMVGRLTPLRPARPSADLSPDQTEAVARLGGAACIVAPAGSGKTRVLTERACYLIRDLGVSSRAVCLVAFNVRARAEMEDRTADLHGLQVRTLNSLALAICNGTGGFAKPTRHRRVEVADELAVRGLLDGLVPRKRRRAMTDPLAPWIEALSASRLGLRNLHEVERDYAPDVQEFAKVAPDYVKQLGSRELVDFDHQILRAIEVLLTDTKARAAARRMCGVLMVDEFQDLTPAHLLLVRLLAGPRADVFGVGDDDQTIYGYTGASPEWLISYNRYFPCASHHLLGVNYRCPADVVQAASNLLSHNHRRIAKRIEPAPGRRPAAPVDTGGVSGASDTVATGLRALEVAVAEPDVITALSETVLVSTGGAEAVLDRVRNLFGMGVKLSDIAVLARVNSTLLAPQVVLSSAGIECMNPVGPWLLKRTGVRAALAWLELASAQTARLSSDALAAAARCPPRAISPMVINWISEQGNVAAIRALGRRVKDQRTSERVLAFAADVQKLGSLHKRGATTVQLLEAVRDLGLGASLDDRLDASRRSVDRSAHGDDLRALLAVARLHDDPVGFGVWLKWQLSDEKHRSGIAAADERSDRKEWGQGVRLTTVHKVKGMEWPHVIVFGASDGLMPHRLSGDTEEERRIFHVAVTRCSESLLIVVDGAVSPYLAELTRQAPETSPAVGSGPQVPATETLSSDDTSRSKASSRKPAASKPAVSEAPMTAEEKARYDMLRQWRLERSKTDGVRAFRVFGNRVMAELARRRPTTDEALLQVPGIGPAKLADYGEELKKLLKEN